MKNSPNDREILYSMLDREVENLLRGTPLIAFSGAVSNYVKRLVDPYVRAFTDEEEHIDSDQLAAFTTEEAQNKIKAFKERYETSRRENK